MKSACFIGLLFLTSVSAYISGASTLYPGYVINYVTPKDKADDHFAFIPITGLDSTSNVSVFLGIAISSSNPSKPKESLFWSRRELPTFATPILTSNSDGGGSVNVGNVSNDFYWVGGKSDCSGTISTCKNDVEAEVSLWNYNTSTLTGIALHWPPYMLLDQRRTAKFKVPGLKAVYFWLTVTSNDLTADGTFNLFMGVQFWGDDDDAKKTSAVQMSVWEPTAPWATAAIYNTTTSLKGFYPRDPTQQNDWIQPSPTALEIGIYKVAAFNTKGSNAQFTTKVGFNKSPVQAAYMNASFSPLGLIALVLLCVMKHLF